MATSTIKPVHSEVYYKSYTTSYSGSLQVYRYGKIRFLCKFIDVNVPDGTVLCTLDEIDRPVNWLPWLGGLVYAWNGVQNSKHKIGINADTGKVIFENSDGTAIWGEFYCMYLVP